MWTEWPRAPPSLCDCCYFISTESETSNSPLPTASFNIVLFTLLEKYLVMPQTARRQSLEEVQLINLSASSARLSWLATCIIYLLLLRFLGALIRIFTHLPLCLWLHTSRIESRIANLAASVLRVAAGEAHSASSGQQQQRRGRHRRRDGSYSAQSLPSGPADTIIAPRHSSLEFEGMSEASYRRLDTRWSMHRPSAPRPPRIGVDGKTSRHRLQSLLHRRRCSAAQTHGALLAMMGLLPKPYIIPSRACQPRRYLRLSRACRSYQSATLYTHPALLVFWVAGVAVFQQVAV